MSRADYFAPGQWNFYCDLCGRKNKSGNAMLTWDGHYVCKEHKEVRNPQDFVRGVAAEAAIPWRRSNGQAAVPPASVYGGWFALGVQTQPLSGFGTGKWHPRQPETLQIPLAETTAGASESFTYASSAAVSFSETTSQSEGFSVARVLTSNPLNSSTLNSTALS